MVCVRVPLPPFPTRSGASSSGGMLPSASVVSHGLSPRQYREYMEGPMGGSGGGGSASALAVSTTTTTTTRMVRGLSGRAVALHGGIGDLTLDRGGRADDDDGPPPPASRRR